ncbi:unnamed protein product [Tuber melanosporum]|uniref:(Perigord truffle) hypothetical protein n=1 Tax=Tuber melanosporum (strain Mel28) TaxID=656061 RepID=D5GAN9_TUBMM|nr:uncharacterized protein GSTUM_00003707001 [Tuber melanosporum]CAZ81582.1 unnamed protein product [Tuber melanosporum]
MTKTAPIAAANVAGKRPDAAPGETMMDIGGAGPSGGVSCRRGGGGEGRVDQGGINGGDDELDDRNGGSLDLGGGGGGNDISGGGSGGDGGDRARDDSRDSLNDGGDGDVGRRGRESDGRWQAGDDGGVLRNVRLADTQEVFKRLAYVGIVLAPRLDALGNLGDEFCVRTEAVGVGGIVAVDDEDPSLEAARESGWALGWWKRGCGGGGGWWWVRD